MSQKRAGLLLPLLALAASISSAETWPAKLGESDKACLDSLRDADAVVRNPHAEARVGINEKLRATLDLCDRPEVDARFTARAVRLAMILPEFSSPLKKIAALEAVVSRLEELPEPPPELVRTLDDLTGPLCRAGRGQEATRLFNRLIDLRASIFGKRSLEAARGWIHLAHLSASKECGEQPHGEDLARYAAGEAVKLIAERPDCGEDYFTILGEWAGVLEALGKPEAASELGLLFLQLSDSARLKTRAPPIARWDEPLPEP